MGSYHITGFCSHLVDVFLGLRAFFVRNPDFSLVGSLAGDLPTLVTLGRQSHLGRFQGIGKDVPRSQRTLMGNPYISPIARGYL